jgi:hypothetical protein
VSGKATRITFVTCGLESGSGQATGHLQLTPCPSAPGNACRVTYNMQRLAASHLADDGLVEPNPHFSKHLGGLIPLARNLHSSNTSPASGATKGCQIVGVDHRGDNHQAKAPASANPNCIVSDFLCSAFDTSGRAITNNRLATVLNQAIIRRQQPVVGNERQDGAGAASGDPARQPKKRSSSQKPVGPG